MYNLAGLYYLCTMSKYLITGGAGFIGSHIADELVRCEMGEVIIYDNLSSGHRENIEHLGDKIQMIEGDVRDRDHLLRIMDGVDCVFHEAAFVSAFDSFNKIGLTNEVNLIGTVNVLESAKSAGARRVVLASSAAVYGNDASLPCVENAKVDPQSPYAITKVAGEFYARLFASSFGVETVCLRYFNVFGPRQDPSSEYSGVISRFFDAVLCKRRPVIFGDGKHTRDFIFVKDVARANILAANSDRCGKGEAINIGSGVETRLNGIIAAIEKAVGKEIEPLFKDARENDIRRSVAKVKLSKKLLGFKYETPFVDGIRELFR